MVKTVAIVATLDTKGEESAYIKKAIQGKGLGTVVIDTGILEKPPFPPDISRDEVVRAAGRRLEEIIAVGDESKSVAVMVEGAMKIVQQLYSEGRIDGIISLGGTIGTAMGLGIMKALPVGVPKLMVSTIAFTPLVTGEEVSTDQTMMQCVVDMWGLDRLSTRTLKSAALAIAAMTEAYEREPLPEKPLIGITTLGTRACKYVLHAKPLLEQKGYEIAVFHATGMGGRAFEQLIEEGVIAGVLDLSPQELISRISGGYCDAGPKRLETAGEKGIPQVVGPGNIDFVCCAHSLETLPPQFRGRKVHVHHAKDTAPQATVEEMVTTAELIAEKLSKATGPAAVLIPKRGFSEFDKLGGLFYNPKGRKAFAEALKKHIAPKISVIELDVHINDPEFAEQAVAILDDMMKGKFGS